MEMVIDKDWLGLSATTFSSNAEDKSKETMSLKAETDESNIDNIGDSQEQVIGEVNEKPRSIPLLSSSQEAQEIENLETERWHKKARTKREDITEEGTHMYNQPYIRWPATGLATERGWLEIAVRMGVTRPAFYLTKITTRSDTDPNQHRFQLTKADITSAMHPLKVLARSAKRSPVTVKVLDRKGYMYEMGFKYLATSHTFRFMGGDYTQFLRNSELKANQIMDIWGLPREGEGEEQWLAFVNSDERIVDFED